jgi:hypothetical protein
LVQYLLSDAALGFGLVGFPIEWQVVLPIPSLSIVASISGIRTSLFIIIWYLEPPHFNASFVSIMKIAAGDRVCSFGGLSWGGGTQRCVMNRIIIIVLAGMFYDSLAIIAEVLRFTRIQGMEKRDRKREDNSRRHKNISEETKTMVEGP